MSRIAAIIASFVIVFGAGAVTSSVAHRTAPICIQINSDGNPAPSSCSNPNSYQVNK